MTKAKAPNELSQLLIEFFNSGKMDELASLYEENAVLINPATKKSVTGRQNIKEFFLHLYSKNVRMEEGVHRPVIISGDIALTSSVIKDGTVTAEIARKQKDESWLWVIDQPAIAKENTL